MYLSKPILFIIIVVVLFIGGTSGLIHHVENGSKHSNSKRGRSGNHGNHRNNESDSSSSSESDSSDNSDSDSDSDERRFNHLLNHKVRNSQSVFHDSSSWPSTDTGTKPGREGFTASNNVKCMPGCKIATSVTGNCKWIPESEPRHKQRLVCPHTCDTGFRPSGGGVKCETNLDCSDCTPQPDFTVVGYTSFEVKQTTPNPGCTKGAQCVIASKNALTVCNPYVSPNNPAQNLVCTKKPGSETEYVWTEPDAAAKQIPFHADQAKLLACDAKQGCAVDGDTCMNANFDKLYCNDNIWVTDPKYDKSSYSTDKKGTGASSSASPSSSSSNSSSSSTGNSGSAANQHHSGELRDNYYVTNYFFGPKSNDESTYTLGLEFGDDDSNYKRKSKFNMNNKNKNRKNERISDNEKKPGILDKIKGAFKNEKKANADVGLGLYGNNYGVGGNATVPPLVPKGTVATVQAYESTIKL
jgi:hypothetical protein